MLYISHNQICLQDIKATKQYIQGGLYHAFRPQVVLAYEGVVISP
jgi:hypothetical protein